MSESNACIMSRTQSPVGHIFKTHTGHPGRMVHPVTGTVKYVWHTLNGMQICRRQPHAHCADA